MNCLIIGGTGTISEGIAAEAVRRGYNVTVLNRGNNSTRVPKGADVIHGDINDISAMEGILQCNMFDVIVDPLIYNVEQMKVRTGLFESHCRRYVFISSAAVFGKGEKIMDECSPKSPVWDYGIKKLQCEKFLEDGKFSFDYVIIRPSITYGDIRIPVPVACRKNPWTLIDRIENDRPLVCFEFTGEHETTHNLMNIRDFSAYAVGLFDKREAGNNDYIICSDCVYTWAEAYKYLYAALGKEMHIYEVDKDVFKFMNPSLYDDVVYDKDSRGVNFSNGKVKRDTGIALNEVPLEEGIKALVMYLEDNYQERPLEDEFNLMTDAILLCGVKRRDQFLENYLNGFSQGYRKTLKNIWRKRKLKSTLKGTFIYRLLKQ